MSEPLPARARPPHAGVAIGALLGLCFFLCYNANGREIPSADSHAAKFSSVMLARRHVLSLDGVVGRQPLYGGRQAFVRDRQGHWRNSYPLPPVLEGAAVAALLRGLGVLSLDAPLAPAIVSKIAASLFTALAGVFAFVTARRFCGAGRASLVATGFSLGTGLWPMASQTLWQHASFTWSLMAAIALWTGDGTRTIPRSALIGALLGWSLSGRPQTLPMIGILAIGALWNATPRGRAALAGALLVSVSVFAGLNVYWFGHPAGGQPQFEQLSLSIHNARSTWQSPLQGIAGLLFSPSRGLLVFSPIVAVALFARARRGRPVIAWTLAAAAAQLLLYGSYSVWWGGYTYGPRYLLDLLPALVPAAALGMDRLANAHVTVRAIAAAALAWSIVAAATGAFCYPNEQWNTDPVNLDQAHERLWEVRDSQIPRCWSRGLAPQNFVLFDREVWRRSDR
jgi:hypothetical protein